MRTEQITGNAPLPPFAEEKQTQPRPRSEWQQALDEGAMTVDEFVAEMKARIEKWPDNA
jgi:hypothetical protein